MGAEGAVSIARIFAAELENRGVEPDQALELSAKVIASYPWARRIGVPSVTRQLTERGLEPDSAREFAQTLLALELFDQGATLDEVLSVLREGDTDVNASFAIAIGAARIQRALRPQRSEPNEAPRMGFALDLIGALVIVLPLALLYLFLR